MNQIITIQTSSIHDELVQTVNARDLHEFLESKQQFSHWIKDRIEKYNFIEEVDYIVLSSTLDKKNYRENQQLTNWKTAIEYHITLDMAKELSMVERNAKGKEARQYFIECEKKVTQRTIDPIQSSLLILEFATKHLRLAPSGILGGLQKIQSFYQLPNSLSAYAVDSNDGVSSEVTHSLTHLLKEHEVGISIHKAYQILENLGYVERKTRKKSNGGYRGFWALTEKGLEFGKNVTDPNHPRQTQPHFYDAKFEKLHETVFGV